MCDSTEAWKAGTRVSEEPTAYSSRWQRSGYDLLDCDIAQSSRRIQTVLISSMPPSSWRSLLGQ
jgi:hypothetical protein